MESPFFFGIIFDELFWYNAKLKLVMKKLLFISMLSVFAVFSSCDEDEVVESQIDFLFKETGCSNPWHSSDNYSDEEYLQVN